MVTSSPLLSELPFGSFLIYPGRPFQDLSARAASAKRAILVVKGQKFESWPDPAAWTARVAEKMAEDLPTTVLRGFFDDAVLIPVPRSGLPVPASYGPALWPAEAICRALVSHSLGREVFLGVQRTEAVPKSATSKREDRTTALRHFETIGYIGPPIPRYGERTRFILVDDVISRGETLLGAASRLRTIFPENEIVGFGLGRTDSQPTDLESPIDPKLGRIKRTNDGRSLREDFDS